MGIGAWIALGWELVKLLPEVVAWVKSRPFKGPRDAVRDITPTVREALKRQGVGNAPTPVPMP